MDIITRKQLNILIQLAVADKHFSSVEREKIFELARVKGFPQQEVKDLIVNPEPIGSFGALSDSQKFEYLYTCIELMLLDKKIFESEIKFCKDVAIKLGFKQDVVKFLQEEIYEHKKEKLKELLFERYT